VIGRNCCQVVRDWSQASFDVEGARSPRKRRKFHTLARILISRCKRLHTQHRKIQDLQASDHNPTQSLALKIAW